MKTAAIILFSTLLIGNSVPTYTVTPKNKKDTTVLFINPDSSNKQYQIIPINTNGNPFGKPQ